MSSSGRTTSAASSLPSVSYLYQYNYIHVSVVYRYYIVLYLYKALPIIQIQILQATKIAYTYTYMCITNFQHCSIYMQSFWLENEIHLNYQKIGKYGTFQKNKTLRTVGQCVSSTQRITDEESSILRRQYAVLRCAAQQ